MKKLFALLVALVLSLSSVACLAENEPALVDFSTFTTVGDFYDNGFESQMATYYEDGTVYYFVNYETNQYVLTKTEADPTVAEAIDALDFFSDTYWEDCRKIEAPQVLKKMIDLETLKPTQEELDAMVGITIRDLENMEYDQVGYISTESGFTFTYSGARYTLTVIPEFEEGASVDMDDYSRNAVRAMKIASVVFEGFSDSLMDDETLFAD